MYNFGTVNEIEMNSKAFVESIEKKLMILAPITEFMIKKQLSDLGATRETLTHKKAKKFIERMTEALQLCLGPDGSKMARRMMLKELRTHSDEDEDDIFNE
jgi:hypothetical protein